MYALSQQHIIQDPTQFLWQPWLRGVARDAVLWRGRRDNSPRQALRQWIGPEERMGRHLIGCFTGTCSNRNKDGVFSGGTIPFPSLNCFSHSSWTTKRSGRTVSLIHLNKYRLYSQMQTKSPPKAAFIYFQRFRFGLQMLEISFVFSMLLSYLPLDEGAPSLSRSAFRQAAISQPSRHNTGTAPALADTQGTSASLLP